MSSSVAYVYASRAAAQLLGKSNHCAHWCQYNGETFATLLRRDFYVFCVNSARENNTSLLISIVLLRIPLGGIARFFMLHEAHLCHFRSRSIRISRTFGLEKSSRIRDRFCEATYYNLEWRVLLIYCDPVRVSYIGNTIYLTVPNKSSCFKRQSVKIVHRSKC